MTAIPPDDGSLADGNYGLRAVVSDAVGNSATITTDRNGTPEVITIPLRIVTRLTVGPARRLARRCTPSRTLIDHGHPPANNQPDTARLVRRCSQMPAAHRAVALGFAQQAVVSGVLQTAGGEPVAGAQVQVFQHPPGWSSRLVGSATSDSHGQFTYTLAAGPSRTLGFSFAGSATMRPSAATAAVAVLGKATIEVSRSVHAGRVVRIAGRVLGGYIPAGGVLVQLQYQVRGLSLGWAPFGAPVRAGSRGRFTVAFGLPAGAAGYTYLFRSLIAGQNGWPYLSARSNTIARTVT